tara:strand:+ start:105 stop:1139 length:1035 start_codon:yes stop_codon:yes gene_type:complete
MKIAIVTDTHFGARKGSKHLHDYFELFYRDIFFPYLEEHKIDTVIHMGDIFDSRKAIDLQSLEWSKKVVLEPLKKYNVYLTIGNHDCYYKNTNNVNSPELLLKNYSNINVYTKTTEIELYGLKILLIPWINSENFEETKELINKSSAKVAMGHLELNGFRAHKHHVMEDGMGIDIFDKFEKVYSGHFHTRSDNEKIYYLGNPYEMYWNDVNDDRGFHIFDTDKKTHQAINNPYRLFYNIYYDDTPYQTFDFRKYSNKIVKVIVRKKTDIKLFEKFIDKLYNSGIQDLKIVENFALNTSDNFEDYDEENTLSILNRYIDDSDFDYDKSIVKNIFQNLYKQACEVE